MSCHSPRNLEVGRRQAVTDEVQLVEHPLRPDVVDQGLGLDAVEVEIVKGEVYSLAERLGGEALMLRGCGESVAVRHTGPWPGHRLACSRRTLRRCWRITVVELPAAPGESEEPVAEGRAWKDSCRQRQLQRCG